MEKTEENKYELRLYSNEHKGSGKCWVAEIDELKTIKRFIEPYSTLRNEHRTAKIFLLPDGKYLSCQKGTKLRDKIKYFTIKNGEYIGGI